MRLMQRVCHKGKFFCLSYCLGFKFCSFFVTYMCIYNRLALKIKFGCKIKKSDDVTNKIARNDVNKLKVRNWLTL